MPIGDWNTPDDDLVWEGIAPHIPQKSDDRKYIWIWWGLAVLMLVLLGWLMINKGFALTESSTSEAKTAALTVADSHKLNNIDSKNIDSKDVLTSESLDKKEAFASIKNTQNISGTTNASKNTIVKETNSVRTPFVSKTTIIEKNAPAVVSTASNNQERNRPLLLPIAATQMMENVAISTTIEETKKQQLVNDIQVAPFWQLQNLALENTLIQTVDCKIPEKDDDGIVSQISASLNIGAVFWEHKISNQYTSDLSPFDFNYADNWGWQANLTAEITANKYLTPFVGIQYESVEVSSGHNSAISYDPTDVQGANAHIYTQNLATPYGLAEATFRLDNEENIAPDVVDLVVDFKSSHQIHNWSMPLGLKVYPFGKKQRFQLNTSIGMGINYLSGIKNSLENIDTHHDLIHYAVDSPAIFDNPTIEKWHFDVRLGTDVEYFFNPDLQVKFQYNWSRGLNPVFQQNDYATKINRHQLSIGLIKTLGF